MRFLNRRSLAQAAIVACVAVLISACGNDGPPVDNDVNATPEPGTKQASNEPDKNVDVNGDDSEEYTIPTITLGASGGAAKPSGKSPTEAARDTVGIVDALDPLQILIGSWRGVTNKEFGQGKAVDDSNWAWDFLTNPEQPALVMKTKDNPYYKNARVTWVPEKSYFLMTMTTVDDGTRRFQGEYAVPVKSVVGDDEKMHRTYKLQFNEVETDNTDELWQLVFNQQENNRFLLELAKKRGSRFVRMDTVASQRQGTSFALSDEDYGDRTCIISAGLGTSQVSYKGKSYWVCCSGCRAAFEEDPERWLAKLAKKDSE